MATKVKRLIVHLVITIIIWGGGLLAGFLAFSVGSTQHDSELRILQQSNKVCSEMYDSLFAEKARLDQELRLYFAAEKIHEETIALYQQTIAKLLKENETYKKAYLPDSMWYMRYYPDESLQLGK